VESVLLHDPRVALWDRTMESIRERPWIGFGFGREVLGDRFAVELHNPMLVHAHNLYLSLLLQIGTIGLAAYGLVLLTLIHAHLRFLRAPDDVLAQMGVVGLAIVAGWVTKNLTDDFFFRSNAKEFWLLQAMLVGYGMRRLAKPP
jgi:O-antigen ligase